MTIQTLWTIAFALLAGCATTQVTSSTLPPEARTHWERCEPAVTAWCQEHSHHEAARERACVRDAAAVLAAATQETERRAAMESRGCGSAAGH